MKLNVSLQDQKDHTVFPSPEPPARRLNKWKSLKRDILRHWQMYPLMLVPTVFLMVFNYWPMLGTQIAFRNYDPILGIWRSPWVGWQQFHALFSGPYFWPLIDNTLTLSVYYIIVSIPAQVILAIAINEVRNQRFQKFIQTITYAPYFISVVVVVGMMQILLSPTSGPLAQLFHLFGNSNPPNLLGSSSAFSSVYVWSGVWQETGYGAVIYLAALVGVSPDLYEAAKIDGATRLQKIWHIDLPSLKPTITILLILSLGGLLTVGFEKVYLLQNYLNMSHSQIIATYVYETGILNGNISFAAAVGLFQSVIALIMIVIVNYAARRVSETSLF